MSELDFQEKQIAKNDETIGLLQMAVEKGLDTDKLEKLIALRNGEIARLAKEDFDANFSKMQAEFPAVVKQKPVKRKDGTILYTYAPLETLQSAIDPIIHKYKFSYRWREEERPDGGKRIRIIISGFGHTDSDTFFDVPKLTGTDLQNAAQVAGSMSSYGRRNTFISGFGITVEGEDDDAQSLTFSDGVKYADHIRKINEATDMKTLLQVFTEAYDELKGDVAGQRKISTAKDIRKKELSHGTKNA